MDDDEFNAHLPAILDNLRHHGVFNHDARDVHRSGHVENAGICLQAEDLGFFGMDRVDPSLEIMRDQVFYNTVSDGKSVVGSADHGDATGSKQGIKHCVFSL